MVALTKTIYKIYTHVRKSAREYEIKRTHNVCCMRYLKDMYISAPVGVLLDKIRKSWTQFNIFKELIVFCETKKIMFF